MMAGQKFALNQQTQQLQNTGLGLGNQQQALALQQAQQAAQQQDQARARQQAYVQAIQGLGPAPTNDAYLRLNSQFPEFAEPTQKLASQWGAERTRNETLAGVQYLRVLQSDPNQAAQLAQQRADASKNAGDQQMQQYWQSHADEAKNLASVADPAERSARTDAIRNATFLQIAAVDPTRFKDIATSLKLPGEIAKGEIEPQKIASDIDASKLKGKIDLLDTQIKQADSDTKRGELQLNRDKLQAELDQKKGTAGNEAQSSIDSATQALATVDALLKHPGLDKALGPLDSLFPTSGGSNAADFEAMVDTLKSQQFLTNVASMKGTGALSDAEGARLERAVSSLSLKQSEGAFRNSLGVIKATLEKAQQKALAGGKAPMTGGAFVAKVPGFGVLTEGRINSIMQAMPGMTREQVLQLIQQNTGATLPGAPVTSGVNTGQD
jgi:hypothetical protein